MRTVYFKYIGLTLFAAFVSAANISFAAEKKNVCAMTINSNDEIELFKKHLSPNLFNFIELTKTPSEKSATGIEPDNAWLEASCKKGIQCDVLVISGHFGGAFFGSSSIRLPLETLETASCDSACSGILHKPKEVFLFGCNTLAGKEKDTRTPEQYAQVLVDDGFSLQQAQQIAAFRYSPIGSSFNDRMSRIFSKVPRIYGFTSIAPSGKNIAPHIGGYLKSIAPTYFQQLTDMTSGLNTNLRERLKGVPFAQTKGADNANSPVCYIKNKNTSTIGKLKYAIEVLNKGGALELAPYLSDFFEGLDKNILNPAERRLLEEVYENTTGREKLEAFVAKPIKGLLKPQVDILNLMLNVNWISEKNYDGYVSALVLEPIYKGNPLSRATIDQLCSLKVKVQNIDVKKIKEEQWSDIGFLFAIDCLKPSNIEFMEHVAQLLPKLTKGINIEYAPGSENRINLIIKVFSILRETKVLTPTILNAVLPLLENERFMALVVNLAGSPNFTSKELRGALERLAEKLESQNQIVNLLQENIIFQGRENKDYLRAALQDYLSGQGKHQHFHFRSTIENSQSFRNLIINEIKKNQEPSRVKSILKLMDLIHPLPNDVYATLTEIALSNPSAGNQSKALVMLATQQLPFDQMRSIFTRVYKTSTNYQTRLSALKGLISSGEDEKSTLLSLMETTENSEIKRYLQIELFKLQYRNTALHTRGQRELVHPLLRINTGSQLLTDLNSGKIPYYFGGQEPNEDIAIRSIVIGVPNRTEDIISANSNIVLYNLKNKTFLGLLPDYNASQEMRLYSLEDLYFVSNYDDGWDLITSALQMNSATGAVDQNYSDSLLKLQMELIEKLRAQNKSYSEIFDSNTENAFKVTKSSSGKLEFELASTGVGKNLSATGVLLLTPGKDGIGTATLQNYKVKISSFD